MPDGQMPFDYTVCAGRAGEVRATLCLSALSVLSVVPAIRGGAGPGQEGFSGSPTPELISHCSIKNSVMCKKKILENCRIMLFDAILGIMLEKKKEEHSGILDINMRRINS